MDTGDTVLVVSLGPGLRIKRLPRQYYEMVTLATTDWAKLNLG